MDLVLLIRGQRRWGRRSGIPTVVPPYAMVFRLRGGEGRSGARLSGPGVGPQTVGMREWAISRGTIAAATRYALNYFVVGFPASPSLRRSPEEAQERVSRMSLHSVPDEERAGYLSQEISTLIVQTLHEYSGRGPTKAQTTIGRNSVHCVLADTLTRAEHTLAEAGHADEVLRGRWRMQQVMRPHLVAEVERLMKRGVVAFMSDNHIGPDLAVESFVLAPEQKDDPIA
jgi:uncharacterized protein YbcI